jgi:hypothetical protein
MKPPENKRSLLSPKEPFSATVSSALWSQRGKRSWQFLATDLLFCEREALVVERGADSSEERRAERRPLHPVPVSGPTCQPWLPVALQ